MSRTFPRAALRRRHVLLVDRAPRILDGNVADADNRLEYVWGQDGTRVGVLNHHLPARWFLLLHDGERFRAPRFTDAVHLSRPAAIARALELTPAALVHDDRARVWGDGVARMARAGISTEFSVTMRFPGASGTICAQLGCSNEAYVAETITGFDLGITSRLACYVHAGAN